MVFEQSLKKAGLALLVRLLYYNQRFYYRCTVSSLPGPLESILTGIPTASSI
jgi:hypothetical protein